ncbi:halocyanin domain-containing protein [Halorussus halophilus]|uniref:halocyanin domain-containing protein n=1 Tax=Halorussus halophilus TaxID=2650975 RepID=UPI0013017A3A|nr:halocyanin domain-containing protein [Halorussus halophilus]
MNHGSQSDGLATRRSFLRGVGIATGATAVSQTSVGIGKAQSGPDYGDWFSNTSNFSGTYDFTGKSNVTIHVGAKGNGSNYAFAPAAIRVDAGTKVTWKWTGKGGSHNVIAKGGSFESSMNSKAGATFTHTFEKEGQHKYYCSPHKMMGMKGAVVVGGSGGKDPSQLDLGSSSKDSSGNASEGGNPESDGFSISFVSASVITGMVMAFLSPVLLGVISLLDRED